MRIIVALLCWLALAASAQTYPNRAVKVVVPWPPGQATDIAARAEAERLQVALDQPFVIENKPGAGGAIGSENLAWSAARRASPRDSSSGTPWTMHAPAQTPHAPRDDA